MSRSIAKKFRGCPTIGFFKKEANRKVRRTKDIDNGSIYKLLYDTWTINDGHKAKPVELQKDGRHLERK